MMSEKHYIQCKDKFDIIGFNEKLSKTIKYLRIKEKKNNRFNYKVKGKSYKGVDFIYNGDKIEVVNSAFSNEDDLKLTNILMERLFFFTNVFIMDFLRSDEVNFPIYNIKRIKKFDEEDRTGEVSSW